MSTAFVRYGECDLRCGWCDSPGTWRPARECRIETAAGSAEFRSLPNPVGLDTILAALEALEVAPEHFVSITGGEPLLQPGPVLELAMALRERGLRVYLETHGLAADALATLVEYCNVVSMDWKLASDVRRASAAKGEVASDFHSEHERFFEVALRAEEVFVKVVVTRSTLEEELVRVSSTLAKRAPETLLVLQPVTPFARVQERPHPGQLLAWMRLCSQQGANVRLIPQTHPIYGAL